MFNIRKTSNIWMLIVSLVLAIALWVYVVGEEAVEVSRDVPLKITTPAGVTVVQSTGETVKVLFSVPRNMLTLFESQEIVVSHEITGIEEAGNYSFNLKAQDVERSSMIIKVKQIIPERVVLTLDKVINKRLPVVADLVNDPAAGFKVDKDAVQIDPNAVLVSGAESVLEKTQFVLTEPIDLIGRIRSFRKKVSIGQSQELTVLNERLIDVFIPIKEELAERIVEDVPILIMNASRSVYDIALSPAKVTIALRGPKQVVDRMVNDEIDAFVNVVDLAVGKYKLPLQLTLPTGVSLRDTVPVIDVALAERAEVPLSRTVIAAEKK